MKEMVFDFCHSLCRSWIFKLVTSANSRSVSLKSAKSVDTNYLGAAIAHLLFDGREGTLLYRDRDAIGLLAAFALYTRSESMLLEVNPTDPATFVSVAVLWPASRT